MTNLILLLSLTGLLAWAIYDEAIVNILRGKTLLSIPLLRRGRADCTIFTGLIAILIYRNITSQGAVITTWLLGFLALAAIYLFWFRTPKIRFKSSGLFFGGGWSEYNHIKAMNLTEDGVLVIELINRRLYIRVKNIDDLERIYKFLVSIQ